MIRYRLKPYLLAFRNGPFICVGIPGTKRYIEFDDNDFNLALLHDVVYRGIEKKTVLSTELYSDFEKLGLLTERAVDSGNRNHLFFDYKFDRALTKKERQKSILIFGAGAGGSTLCYQLAQLRFENITIVDFDRVAESDLTKCFTFHRRDIGKLKVEALHDRILENFDIKISNDTTLLSEYEELKAYIKAANPAFVVKACDPDSKFRKYLNESCFSLKLPYIQMSYTFDFLNMGPLFVPQVTGCDNSLNADIVKIYGDHYDSDVKFERLCKDYFVHPSTNSNINLLSAFIAKEILYFLSGNYDHCKTIGRRVTFDAGSLRYGVHKAECSDSCTVCSNKIKIEA